MAFGRDQVSLTRGDVMLDATDLQHTADVHDSVVALVRLPLFPGSGAVTRAWAAYTGQQPSPPRRRVTRRARPGPTRRPRPRATLRTRRLRPHTTAMPSCPWHLPRDRPHRAGDGPVPWPGSLPGPWSLARVLPEARCQGWPKAISGGNAKRPDIEGKHVTIQGPSPDPSPVTNSCTFRLRDLAAEPSNP